jgi:EAL and modified HD-GYP domain-containing signal transduction protein
MRTVDDACPETGSPERAASSFWIARQPIFDRSRKVVAYELLFRGLQDVAHAQIDDGARATAQLIIQGSLSADVDAVSCGLPVFVNFTNELLLGESGLALDRLDRLSYGIEVLEDVPPSVAVVDACRRLVTDGFRVALDDVCTADRVQAFAGAATIVKIDWLRVSRDQIDQITSAARHHGMAVLAEKIDDESGLQLAEELGFDYLQGFYLSRPESLRRTLLPSLEHSHLELLQALDRTSIDLGEVTGAIEQDPTAAYRLLRIINSAAYGLNRRVTSIREAVIYLGPNEVRRVATLIMLGSITRSADHLLQDAVARARFCDLVGAELGQRRDRSGHFYLTGLFSNLDGLLGCSMEEALADLPVGGEVSDALVHRRGLAADVLDLAIGYLSGRWSTVDPLSAELDLKAGHLARIYRTAIEGADSIVAA